MHQHYQNINNSRALRTALLGPLAMRRKLPDNATDAMVKEHEKLQGRAIMKMAVRYRQSSGRLAEMSEHEVERAKNRVRRWVKANRRAIIALSQKLGDPAKAIQRLAPTGIKMKAMLFEAADVLAPAGA